MNIRIQIVFSRRVSGPEIDINIEGLSDAEEAQKVSREIVKTTGETLERIRTSIRRDYH
jgi:hypothetical protein